MRPKPSMPMRGLLTWRSPDLGGRDGRCCASRRRWALLRVHGGDRVAINFGGAQPLAP
jgi:hypothetical protein